MEKKRENIPVEPEGHLAQNPFLGNAQYSEERT